MDAVIRDLSSSKFVGRGGTYTEFLTYPQRKNHMGSSLDCAVANDEGLCLQMNDVQSDDDEDNCHSSTVGPIDANGVVPHLAER